MSGHPQAVAAQGPGSTPLTASIEMGANQSSQFVPEVDRPGGAGLAPQQPSPQPPSSQPPPPQQAGLTQRQGQQTMAQQQRQPPGQPASPPLAGAAANLTLPSLRLTVSLLRDSDCGERWLPRGRSAAPTAACDFPAAELRHPRERAGRPVPPRYPRAQVPAGQAGRGDTGGDTGAHYSADIWRRRWRSAALCGRSRRGGGEP